MAQRRSYTIWVIGADGKHKEWTMPDQVFDGLRAEYPSLKLGNELTRMHTWTVRNASKRWGEATVMRGVVRWLNRARAAQARIVAEKRGHVLFGDPAIKKAYEPGKPPPPEVRAVLEQYARRGG
jgi:hypothetical protein